MCDRLYYHEPLRCNLRGGSLGNLYCMEDQMGQISIKQKVKFFVGDMQGFGHDNTDVPVNQRRIKQEEIIFDAEWLKQIKNAIAAAVAKGDFISLPIDSYPGWVKPEPWIHNSDSDDYCGVEYDSEFNFWMLVYPDKHIKLSSEYRLYADGDNVEGYESESEKFMINGWEEYGNI